MERTAGTAYATALETRRHSFSSVAQQSGDVGDTASSTPSQLPLPPDHAAGTVPAPHGNEQPFEAAGTASTRIEAHSAPQVQQPAEAEQSRQRPPQSAPAAGVDLFSVPPAVAPSTGVYAMPVEAFQFRDLDSGRTFYMDKRFWIKDVDTGRVYVLEPNEAPGGSGSSSGVGERGGGAASPSTAGSNSGMRVSDLLSGQALSLEEFEEALGYSKGPSPPAPALPQTAADVAASAQQLAQRGLASLTQAAQASALWVRGKAAAALDKVNSARHPRSVDGAAGYHSDGSPGSPSSSVSGAATAADGQGLPVKVQARSKPCKELSDLRLVQQLPAHQGVVWTMRFSRSGRYLATAGQDAIVRVWEVVRGQQGGSGCASSSGSAGALGGVESRDSGSEGGSPTGSISGGASSYGIPVLRPRAYRTYRGHKQDILDLAWSKTNFLLSASMDKTVRLWHVSMDECLRVFKHTDFVTAIDFHPTDDKHFVSGSIDGKVRLWNVPEQRVVSWQDVHDMVTAVGYARDGRRAVVGTMRGKCRFYGVGDKAGLEYEAQLDVKNKRGQHARGKKVTGLQSAPDTSGLLLITSNDSRIRLYDGYVLRAKYKGHTNKSTQIRASFSPRGDFIVCGSDDGWVYVWSTRKAGAVPGSPAATSPQQKQAGDTTQDGAPAAKEKNASYECFQAGGDIVTVALFAPEATHRTFDAATTAAAPASAAAGSTTGAGTAAQGREAGRQESQVAGAGATARGQVIVTAGYGGEIKIYENVGLPLWL